jgi:hypothetical protein
MTQLTFLDNQPPVQTRRVVWSILKIAEWQGVSKQAVSKNVRRLIGRGLYIERNGRGEVGGVDVGQYYQFLGRPVDLSQLESESETADYRRNVVIRNVANATARLINTIPTHAREIAEAVAKHGEAGAASVLKAVAFDLRNQAEQLLTKHLAGIFDLAASREK